MWTAPVNTLQTLIWDCHLVSLCLPVSRRTPLHYAAVNCMYQCVFALVGSGASVNERDIRGCGPLHYAAAVDSHGKYVTDGWMQCVLPTVLLKYYRSNMLFLTWSGVWSICWGTMLIQLSGIKTDTALFTTLQLTATESVWSWSVNTHRHTLTHKQKKTHTKITRRRSQLFTMILLCDWLLWLCFMFCR